MGLVALRRSWQGLLCMHAVRASGTGEMVMGSAAGLDVRLGMAMLAVHSCHPSLPAWQGIVWCTLGRVWAAGCPVGCP